VDPSHLVGRYREHQSFRRKMRPIKRSDANTAGPIVHLNDLDRRGQQDFVARTLRTNPAGAISKSVGGKQQQPIPGLFTLGGGHMPGSELLGYLLRAALDKAILPRIPRVCKLGGGAACYSDPLHVVSLV
jgi:hypothetical protein